jgi:diguanylate cyclase (GGDEF)-like protein
MIPWPIFAAAFAAGHFANIRVDFRRQSHTLDLTDLALLPAIVFTGYRQVVLAAVVGTVLRSLWGRRPLIKATFNVSLHAFAVAVAAVSFRAVLGGASVLSIRGWLAAVVAVIVAEVITNTGIQAVIVISGRVASRIWAQAGVTILLIVAIDALLGLVAVQMLWSSRAGGLLFLTVAASVGLGFAFHGRLRRRHHRLEQLYRFEQALAGAAETETVIAAVLQETLVLLNVEVAELVYVGPLGSECHTLRLGTTGPVTTFGPHPLVSLLLSSAPSLVAARGATDPPTTAALSSCGFRDAIIVRLPSDEALPRVLVAANRIGANHLTFDTEDLALAEALALPTAMALRNSTLLDQLRHEVEIKQYQASHDGLTGLANRTSFSAKLDRMLATREARSMAGVMVIDLDGFKKLNDTLGHEAGDAFLETLAERLATTVGSSGTVGRLGGDEFAVAIPNAASRSRVGQIAEEVDRAVRAPVTVSGSTVQLRASIGVAIAPFHGTERFVLLRQADLAMYRAKHAGGGVCVQTDDSADHIDRFSLVTALREAIGTSALRLAYQPKISFATRQVTGVEALLRWTHDVYGVIGADQFIPVAEASGLIRPITAWVLENALAQLADWQSAGFNLSMSVNLSPEQTGDANVVAQIRELLGRHQLPPDMLTLEITESGVIQDWGGDAQEVLNSLADLGVRLAIDDFGVGMSSLSRLKTLRFGELKVDKSFITNLATDHTDIAIVTSTINLAHQLGLTVTAEGVEAEGVFRQLGDLGCDTAQGYLISAALGPRELTAWLYDREGHPARRGGPLASYGAVPEAGS